MEIIIGDYIGTTIGIHSPIEILSSVEPECCYVRV